MAPPRARARQRRVLVHVIDDLNLSCTSMARTRDLLVRFVQRSLQPDDLVGLFRTSAAPSAAVTLGADVSVRRTTSNGRADAPEG